MTPGMWFPKLAVLGALALLSMGSVTPAEAQFGRRLKERLKQNAEDKAIQKATDEENKAIDSALAAKRDSAATKPAGTDTAAKAATAAPAPAAAGAPATANPSAGSETAAAKPAGNAALKPGEGAWANYDFVPGNRTIFYEDFSADAVGDFPRRLELKGGNLDVVDWQGAHYLRAVQNYAEGGTFAIPLPEVLPDRFTVELDYTGPRGNEARLYFNTLQGLNYVSMAAGTAGVAGGEVRSFGSGCECEDKFYHARVMVDGRYAKVYVNETRVANVPNANLGRSNKIVVQLPGAGTKMIGSIRVAAGGKKLYDALAEKGRVSTQGIYFDTGSDRIRPESSPTLKEMGTMLKEHPELKLVIEGHTDNVGKPDANQGLSERRAKAVRQFLIDSYQVDGVRLQSKGLGETKPVAPNDSPEGRQSNRRVELVKM